MGLLSRVKGIWYAILNTFVSGLEDRYVIELAESLRRCVSGLLGSPGLAGRLTAGRLRGRV